LVVVADKGYHSSEVLEQLYPQGLRSHIKSQPRFRTTAESPGVNPDSQQLNCLP
jgi:hypothetical protein